MAEKPELLTAAEEAEFRAWVAKHFTATDIRTRLLATLAAARARTAELEAERERLRARADDCALVAGAIVDLFDERCNLTAAEDVKIETVARARHLLRDTYRDEWGNIRNKEPSDAE